MGTIIRRLKQFDWLVIFIIVLGCVSIIQHLVNRPVGSGEDDCFVTVQFSIVPEVPLSSLRSIPKLYLLNSDRPSVVKSINKLNLGEYIVELQDVGTVTDDRFICAGQHLEIGQVAHLNGLLNAEGTIIKLSSK